MEQNKYSRIELVDVREYQNVQIKPTRGCLEEIHKKMINDFLRYLKHLDFRKSMERYQGYIWLADT